MIIKYIELTNFRQFIGFHHIDFSTDNNKKATLIIAPNGTGKTTLLEAFRWGLYGTSELQSIINERMANEQDSRSSWVIEVSIGLIHHDVEYRINRQVKVNKAHTRASLDPSHLEVSFTNNDGVSKNYQGKEAEEFINDVLPADLFPYFFFKGESIERIGKEISNGKNSSNSTFVKAIRGMLGLNWLYQELRDLKRVSSEFANDIENSKGDVDLPEIQRKLNMAIEDEERYLNTINETKENIQAWRDEADKVTHEIIASGSDEVAEKQLRVKKLVNDYETLMGQIYEKRAVVFTMFSQDGFRHIAEPLYKVADEVIEDSGDVDAGIPGIDINAIDYMLKNHRCICGEELVEGSEAYVNILKLREVVPPNKFGANIAEFQTNERRNLKNGASFIESFNRECKALNQDMSRARELHDELEKLNEEIKNAPDVSELKKREADLNQWIDEGNIKIGTFTEKLKLAQQDKEKYRREKDYYKTTDQNLMILEERELQVDMLISRIEKLLETKEREKRSELQQAINEIFSEVFNLNLAISLNDEYKISFITSEGQRLSDEFENSTSQDAILAFAFIGGIIKLARNKTLQQGDSSDDTEVDVEPYPLLMDAPTSSFDIARIDSFCQIMPNIAEQVIFFIKDTDGYHVKENLKEILGKEYVLKQLSYDETKEDEVY